MKRILYRILTILIFIFYLILKAAYKVVDILQEIGRLFIDPIIEVVEFLRKEYKKFMNELPRFP